MGSLFNLIIVDHDKRVFNVIENINDDEYYNGLVVKAQQENRDIRCFTTTLPFERAIQEYNIEYGYEYKRERIL